MKTKVDFKYNKISGWYELVLSSRECAEKAAKWLNEKGAQNTFGYPISKRSICDGSFCWMNEWVKNNPERLIIIISNNLEPKLVEALEKRSRE